VFAFAGFLLAAGVAADPIALQKFTSAPGKFTVDMPGKPVESTDKHMDWTQVSFSAVVAGDRVFRVQYIQFGANDVPNYADPQEGLKRFRDGFRHDKTIEGDKVISLGPDKVPGREYWLEAAKGVYVRERLYRRGDRLYIVHVVATTKDFLTSPDANRYFDSFAFTK
jgi:hypothetical protein